MKNITSFCFIFIFVGIAQAFAQHDSTFKSSGKPIIQVFGNFDYNASRDAQKKYAFWFGRAHFGYEYQYSKHWSGKVIIDAGRPTTVGTITVQDSVGNNFQVSNTSKEGAYYTMNLKFACLEWKLNEYFKIQAGAVLQNHYMTMERFWGYRYVAETFQDRYYKMPSSDLGFIAYYKAKEKVGFDVALTNGEGFRFDQDPYGDVKMAAGLDFNPFKGLQTRVFYDYLKSKDPSKPAEQQLFSAFVGYKHGDKFRIDAEYNYRKNNSNIPHHDLFGYSVYGSYRIFNKIEYFVRYDHLMSNKIYGYTHVWNYNGDGQAIITGLHFSPVTNVNLSLNYQGFIHENPNMATQHHVLLSFEYKL